MPFGKNAWKIEEASKINFMLYTCENDVRDMSSFPDKLSKRFKNNLQSGPTCKELEIHHTCPYSNKKAEEKR